MIVKCINYGRRVEGCAFYVDVPDITSKEDAERSPIPCEPCHTRELQEQRRRGVGAFTDDWDSSF